MYGKLIDDTLILAPTDKLMYINNNKFRLVLNPKKKHYLAAGYKEIEYGEMPADEEAVYKVVYTEKAKKIVVSYEIEEAGADELEN